MLAKWKLEMLEILASLSLVSVGFSTWNISATIPITNTVQGNLQADYVIKTDEYVYFDKDGDKQTTPNDGIVLPEYNAGGFVVKNDSGIYENTDTSTLILYFTVDYEKCIADDSPIKDDTYLQIDCDISFTNPDFFKKMKISFLSSSSKNSISFDRIFASITTPNDENPDENPVIVGYNLRLFNYNFTQDDLITVTLQLESSDISSISSLLNNHSFIFNTQVHSSK